MSEFRGRVVLVTGGNSGIGRVAAMRFAASGARVVIAARRTDRSEAVAQEITDAGGLAIAVRCDVTDVADCQAAVDVSGGVDILFNNAGVIYRNRTAETTSDAEWGMTMSVNATGTFNMSRAVLPGMTAKGSGAIVNNASYLGLVGGAGVVAYAASKGAVVQMTRAMALDHASDGIRVNCVCAGSVDTPMLRGEMVEMGNEATVRRRFEEKHPVGRIATPDDVVAAVMYLASDSASFTTGIALPVDGGITAG